MFTGYNFPTILLFRSNTATEGKLASNVKWAMQLHQRREHQASLPPSPLPNMDLHSEMPFAYDMAGDLPIYHLTASTAKTSQSSMH